MKAVAWETVWMDRRTDRRSEDEWWQPVRRRYLVAMHFSIPGWYFEDLLS